MCIRDRQRSAQRLPEATGRTRVLRIAHLRPRLQVTVTPLLSRSATGEFDFQFSPRIFTGAEKTPRVKSCPSSP
eukprot:925562-Pyramimonas_sp.AAC.1